MNGTSVLLLPFGDVILTKLYIGYFPLVNPNITPLMKVIKFVHDTWLKKHDYKKQAIMLPEHMKFFIKEGTVFPIQAHDIEDNYIKFTLDGMALGAGKKNFNTWHVYKPHCSVEQLATPTDAPKNPKPIDKQGSLAERVAQVCEARGYPLDKSGDINIIGIEGMDKDGKLNDDKYNEFNDLLGILLFDPKSGIPYFEHLDVGSTEPGRGAYTGKNRSKHGPARMSLGYHKNIWIRGKHRGKYDALCQWGSGKARYTRDVNKDYSRSGDREYDNGIGINWHAAGKPGYTPPINDISEWSHGCQVIRGWDNFVRQRESVYASPKKEFSYVLLLGSWLV